MSVILATQICHRCMSTQVRQTSSSAKTKALLDRVLRVDHAGEYGAVRIYKGQLAVLGNTAVAPTLKHMLEQEQHHLQTFERLLKQYDVKPTILLPFWRVAGFTLGAGSALLGRKGAMACTVAVETAVGHHYQHQIDALKTDGENGPIKHKQLIEIFSQFRDDELEHLDTGLENDAEQAPFYKTMSAFIQTGCKAAIWASERI